MKKLKFLTLAAIAAATAMVSSCSDNDVLEGVKDTGIPFSVTASTNSGGSRGSDITTLSNFQLWGFGNDQESHFDGDNFTPKAGSSTVFESSITPNWPNTDNCLFYGISNNTSTMAYGVAAGSPGINTTKLNIRNGSFDYTIPTNVADQEDLLVAAAQGNSAQGVNMHFDHALTAAKLHLTMNPKYSKTYYETATTPYILLMKVQKIIIHNIKISGTYTFGTGTTVGASSWTAAENGSWDTDDGTVGDYVLDFTDNPILYQVKNSETLDVAIDIDGNDGNVYFIPQTVSSLDIVSNATDETQIKNYKILAGVEEGTINDSYIELKAIAAAYPYEKLATELQSLIDDDMISVYKEMELLSEGAALTKNGNGDFCDDELASHIIVTKDGEVKDFSSEILSIVENNPTLESSVSEASFYSTVLDESDYTSLFKTFKATLGINGNRVLKIEFVNSTRIKDGSGAYGVAVEAST